MSTTVTIIVDNRARDGLLSEHGLSLWIESEDRRILFDTGQGAALAANASAIGIDLAETDIIVLSHGHYDHAGGITHVLRCAPDAHVYCHPGALQTRYAVRNLTAVAIGISQETKEALRSLPAEHLHWIREPCLLTQAIGLTGPVPRLTTYEDTGGPFYLDRHGERADLIEDDLALWIRTNEGTVTLFGCGHAGLINTLNHVHHLTGDPRFRAVIGGFHLVAAEEQRLEQTVTALQALAPAALIPCHCTGDPATTLLQDTFGEIISPGAAGIRYQF